MTETLSATREPHIQSEEYDPVAEAEIYLREHAVQPEASQIIRLAESERGLTEVDNLNRLRSGEHIPDHAKRAVFENLITWVKESAIPQAVSSVYQPYQAGYFWWDGSGRTTVQVAKSGKAYHASWVYPRVDVEVAEAEHNARTLRPGSYQAFISPKVSAKDALYKAAKQEHLADDDMLRLHWLDMADDGTVRGKYMQSLLVRDVPLSAWVAMLRDPGNIFGKSIAVDDPESALSVMRTFRELELPMDRLPEGVVSLVDAVRAYVPAGTLPCVEKQLALFRGDQVAIHELAENIARRWLDFEVALADSLHAGRAHPAIADFVAQLWSHWTDDDHALFNLHRLADGSLGMSRRLASRLEQAKQNLLLVPAAVMVENERVLEQLGPGAAQRIREEEMRIQHMMREGATVQEITAAEANKNHMVADENVTVGGGCPGDVSGNFRKNKSSTGQDREQSNDRRNGNSNAEKKKWKWSSGLCQVNNCPTRPRKTMVGPCSVCWKCQKKFDRGLDPATEYARRAERRARVERQAAKAATVSTKATVLTGNTPVSAQKA